MTEKNISSFQISSLLLAAAFIAFGLYRGKMEIALLYPKPVRKELGVLLKWGKFEFSRRGETACAGIHKCIVLRRIFHCIHCPTEKRL